jgi:two-component system sensor histidine kinase YesM
MLQYEMADNWDLTRLSTSLASNYNDYEKSLMILRIKEKINAIKTSSRLIEEIKVIVPYINKSIETVTTRDIQKDSMILINSYANMKNKQILYYNNELLLISEYPQIYYKRGLLPFNSYFNF